MSPLFSLLDHQKLEREARICRLLKHPNIGESSNSKYAHINTLQHVWFRSLEIPAVAIHLPDTVIRKRDRKRNCVCACACVCVSNDDVFACSISWVIRKTAALYMLSFIHWSSTPLLLLPPAGATSPPILLSHSSTSTCLDYFQFIKVISTQLQPF